MTAQPSNITPITDARGALTTATIARRKPERTYVWRFAIRERGGR